MNPNLSSDDVLRDDDPVYAATATDNEGCVPANTMTKCELIDAALKYDVYYPTGFTFSETCQLPCVLMFHGGGYKQCSGKDADVMDYLCSRLARRGFVTFNFEYRAGRLLTTKESLTLTKTVQQQLAVGRAVQDVRGAIRSICKMQDEHYWQTHYSSPLQIDKTKMFLAGQSAGCGAVLSAAYLPKSTMAEAASPNIFPAIGGLDVDYYYGQKNYPYIPVNVIKGIFAMWGEFPMPGTIVNQNQALDFFTDNGTITYFPPAIMFHGDDDVVASPNNRAENSPTGNYTMPESPSRNTTSQCLADGIASVTVTHFSPTSPTHPCDIRAIGSLSLYGLLKLKQVKAEVYIDCQMEHGLDDCCGLDHSKKRDEDDPPNCKTISCGFNSDFGTGYLDYDQVNTYMVQRAAVFFQSILANTTIPGASKFINQVNTRYNTTGCKSSPYVTYTPDCTDCEPSVFECP